MQYKQLITTLFFLQSGVTHANNAAAGNKFVPIPEGNLTNSNTTLYYYYYFSDGKSSNEYNENNGREVKPHSYSDDQPQKSPDNTNQLIVKAHDPNCQQSQMHQAQQENNASTESEQPDSPDVKVDSNTEKLMKQGAKVQLDRNSSDQNGPLINLGTAENGKPENDFQKINEKTKTPQEGWKNNDMNLDKVSKDVLDKPQPNNNSTLSIHKSLSGSKLEQSSDDLFKPTTTRDMASTDSYSSSFSKTVQSFETNNPTTGPETETRSDSKVSQTSTSNANGKTSATLTYPGGKTRTQSSSQSISQTQSSTQSSSQSNTKSRIQSPYNSQKTSQKQTQSKSQSYSQSKSQTNGESATRTKTQGNSDKQSASKTKSQNEKSSQTAGASKSGAKSAPTPSSSPPSDGSGDAPPTDGSDDGSGGTLPNPKTGTPKASQPASKSSASSNKSSFPKKTKKTGGKGGHTMSPLICDTNHDGRISAIRGLGISLTPEDLKQKHGAAAAGDKMLAMMDSNGNGEIDGAEVFGDISHDPFETPPTKIGAKNGFEALRYIAQKAEEKFPDLKIIVPLKDAPNCADLMALQTALRRIGNDLGVISEGNSKTIEPLGDIKYVNLDYAVDNQQEDGILFAEKSWYQDQDGKRWLMYDVWFSTEPPKGPSKVKSSNAQTIEQQ